MADESPEARLEGFLAKYDPKIRRVAQAALKTMRTRLPGAVELVYDNYNALAIAFGPTDRRTDLVFSITLYPRWVSLFFTRGADLPDPQKRLRGGGKTVRHIVLADASTLDEPEVRALMTAALARSATPLDASARRRLVIRSVSTTQRPRRPG